MGKPDQLSTIAKVYVIGVVIAGTVALTHSLYQLAVHPASHQWLVLAALTLLSGSFTVKVPRVHSSISVSETFVIICVLVFGPAAATITVAFEGLVISLWLLRRSREVYRVFFNMAAAAFSIWTASHLFYFMLGPEAGPGLSVTSIEFLAPLILFTSVYFVLNSCMVALAVALETRFAPLGIWVDNFAWLSLNYFGGASVAVLLVQYTRDVTLSAIGLIVPFLLITYLTFKTAMGRVEDANSHLAELNKLHLSTIETLAMAIDAKDQITHGHIRRVQSFAVGLARSLGIHDANQIKAIEAASLLHDMGKLAVPEHILNKPGKLTPAEFEKMKAHATVGADILSAIDFPYPVVPIVRHHHEFWKGGGYPDGLTGTDIPIGARILSVVDCFDALTSDRPYRPKLSDQEAVDILLERRGTMYDPLIVDAFISVYPSLTQTTQPTVTPQVSARSAKEALSEITRSSHVLHESDTRAEGFEDGAASTDELLALYELAGALTSPISLADVGDVISRRLRRMLPVSLCVFFVHDSSCDELVVGHVSGNGEPLVQHLRISTGERLSGWVAAHRQTIVNSDAAIDLGDLARLVKPQLRSAISVPLLHGTRLVGVLTLYSELEGVFTENHRRLVEVVAAQVAPTVSRASEFDDNRRRALSDPVTGLPNGEYLRRVVAEAAEESGPGHWPASLLFLRVTQIDVVYQTLGATDGDLAVRHVVGIVRRALRGADILFRDGSADFVVLLTQTDSPTAWRVAERIVAALRTAHRLHDRMPELGLNVLVGTASTPRDGASIRELLATAEMRLGHQSEAVEGHHTTIVIH